MKDTEPKSIFDFNKARSIIHDACNDVVYCSIVNCNDYHALSGRVCKEIVRKLSEMKTNYKFIVNCVMVPENVDNMTTALGLSIRCTDDLMFSVTEEMACGGIMIITIAGQLQQHFTEDTKCLTWAV